MDQSSGSTPDDELPASVTPAALRRLFLLSLLPMLGVLLFAAGGALGLWTAARDNSLDCTGGYLDSTTCVHHSYVPAIVLGVSGLLLVMGGGAFSSYYAARHVGLPLLSALQRRRRTSF